MSRVPVRHSLWRRRNPKIAEQLEKVRANPELMQEYQCRSEAWLALQQELTMPDLVPAPAPAALIDIDEDDDTGTGVAAAADAIASAKSLSDGAAEGIEQLAEQLMRIFSQDPRFGEIIESSLRLRISQRATAIASAVALRQREETEVGPALDAVVAYDEPAQAEVSVQEGWLARVGKVLRGPASRNQVSDVGQGEHRHGRSSFEWSLVATEGFEPPILPVNPGLEIIARDVAVGVDTAAGAGMRVLPSPVPVSPRSQSIEVGMTSREDV